MAEKHRNSFVFSCHELLVDETLDVERIHRNLYLGGRRELTLNAAIQPVECLNHCLHLGRVVRRTSGSHPIFSRFIRLHRTASRYERGATTVIWISFHCGKTTSRTCRFARDFPSRAISEHVQFKTSFSVALYLSPTDHFPVRTHSHIPVVLESVPTLPTNRFRVFSFCFRLCPVSPQ